MLDTWLRLRRSILPGAILAVFGTAAFGLAHAMLIVPIWRRLAQGLPFAAIAGFALAWAFAEAHVSHRGTLNWRDGLLFGVLAWLSLLPMTAFAAFLRVAQMHDRNDDTWEVVGALALAISSGWFAGWLRARRSLAALAMGCATLSLAVAMGGPVPVTNHWWVAALFLSFLPIYAIAGVILAAMAEGTSAAGGSTRRPES